MNVKRIIPTVSISVMCGIEFYGEIYSLGFEDGVTAQGFSRLLNSITDM